jgi:ATP-GRASP peptide maturase of grasp-with-spasm system
MDWIHYLGHKPLRFNGDDFENKTKTISISHKSFGLDLNVDSDNFSREFYSVWFRRWSYNDNQGKLTDLLTERKIPISLAVGLLNSNTSDLSALIKIFLNSLKARKRLTTHDQMNVNKIEVLASAKKAGLCIPAFLLTNSKEELYQFFRNYDKIITKDINHFFFYDGDDKTYANYASIVEEKNFENFPDFFSVSLFQEYIEKDFEIRTFFLHDKFYSMAIFSQASEQTKVDFRNYDHKQPNRTVPYILPTTIMDKLKILTKELNLTTGSIDIIKSPENTYYFLEVNPVGQFGMVSYPCNYNLEYEVAKYLCS